MGSLSGPPCGPWSGARAPLPCLTGSLGWGAAAVLRAVAGPRPRRAATELAMCRPARQPCQAEGRAGELGDPAPPQPAAGSTPPSGLWEQPP